MPAVKTLVRYYAGARAAVGLDEEWITAEVGCTVAQLRDLLAAQHGPTLEPVLAVCSYLIDEVSAELTQVVPDGATVDVLPPFAGG